MSSLKKHFFVTGYLLFYFAINVYKLISHVYPFFDWDESIYAQVGREMIRSHSLVPLWQGMPWLDKPPLVPLFYGLVEKIFFFVKPEISLRLATLVVATITLFFVYAVFLKASKSRLIASLSVIGTSFASIFLQRTTAVNIDVFLLLGWLGYVLFFENFYLSFIFLALSVLGKTLVGFYPAGVMFCYYFFLLFTKKIKRHEFNSALKKIIFQVLILSTWYIVMFLLYGKAFWVQHIVETHFKRVTSSIEFHFGKRTFYLDLIFGQFGTLTWLAYTSLVIFIYQFYKKKVSEAQILFGLFLLPWFTFLNLTKTKIFWYAYPAIPQFSFLIIYPLIFLKNKKVILACVSLVIITSIVYGNFIPGKFFQTYFSHFETHFYLATYAKQACTSLEVLENKETRDSFATLERAGLLITSSKWWGSHPSIVYYFANRVRFLYSTDEFMNSISQLPEGSCLVLQNGDVGLIEKQKSLHLIKTFKPYYLYKYSI